MNAIDADAYLARIGWTGAVQPTLANLTRLATLHTGAIAFENLNPLLGLPVSLDPAAVERKLVCDGRGGYCFEHNLLFGLALRDFGYRVTDLGARVLWGQPEGHIGGRTHMLLQVDLAGDAYIVDVGFGGQTLTGAIRLQHGLEQATPHESVRLLLVDGDWRLQTRFGDHWSSLYRFDLRPQFAPDFEIANYYLSTYANSHFVTGLMAARSAPGRRYALRNREFAVHDAAGGTQRQVLQSATDIRRVLEQQFLLNLAGLPQLDARLQSLPWPPASDASAG